MNDEVDETLLKKVTSIVKDQLQDLGKNPKGILKKAWFWLISALFFVLLPVVLGEIHGKVPEGNTLPVKYTLDFLPSVFRVIEGQTYLSVIIVFALSALFVYPLVNVILEHNAKKNEMPIRQKEAEANLKRAEAEFKKEMNSQHATEQIKAELENEHKIKQLELDKEKNVANKANEEANRQHSMKMEENKQKHTETMKKLENESVKNAAEWENEKQNLINQHSKAMENLKNKHQIELEEIRNRADGE